MGGNLKAKNSRKVFNGVDGMTFANPFLVVWSNNGMGTFEASKRSSNFFS